MSRLQSRLASIISARFTHARAGDYYYCVIPRVTWRAAIYHARAAYFNILNSSVAAARRPCVEKHMEFCRVTSTPRAYIRARTQARTHTARLPSGHCPVTATLCHRYEKVPRADKPAPLRPIMAFLRKIHNIRLARSRGRNSSVARHSRDESLIRDRSPLINERRAG